LSSLGWAVISEAVNLAASYALIRIFRVTEYRRQRCYYKYTEGTRHGRFRRRVWLGWGCLGVLDAREG
jgi:hypothetical protein